MILKVSNLISLQDARYCAAVGFSVVSFNLEKGHVRKMPINLVKEIAGWLSGPEIGLELNQESLDQLEGTELDYTWLCLPVEEWNETLLLTGKKILLSAKANVDLELVHQLIHQSREKVFFELEVKESLELEKFSSVYSNLIVHFQSLDQAESFVRANSPRPFGLSFRQEVEEEAGVIDYHKLDQLLEAL